jgi:hypothetical protein
MHWHWQNLTERWDYARGWKHGRAWLHFARWHWQAEWVVPDLHRIGATLEVDHGDGHEFKVSLSTLAFTIYVCVRAPWVRALSEGEAEVKLILDPDTGAAVHAAVWRRLMEYRSDDPWWRKAHVWGVKDVLLGRPECATEVTRPSFEVDPMPGSTALATFGGVELPLAWSWSGTRCSST